ncbi:MAG: PA0069 family radical SAM protein [Burkholderiales bacterium]|nr:PA0069 family radical SAM protein [Burkholderiales bacterium]
MRSRDVQPDAELRIEFHRDVIKGRGAQVSPQSRFDALSREEVDDGWPDPQEESGTGVGATVPRTTVTAQTAKSIISRNNSPDVPFTQSVNPYYGCEHGCVYCYARPSYAYWGLSPGIDFETRLFAKTNAAELLRAELSRPGYQCETLAIGANTDAYQPVEREWKITRSLLEVCAEFNQPVGLITKSSLVERDIDILAPLAAKGLARVFISVPTFDAGIARLIEPRAAAPYRRIETIRALAAAGIPTGIAIAPVIPVVNDSTMEAALEAGRAAGATEASYILLRLPLEIAELFRDWLALHMPQKAAHVMSVMRQIRGGRDNDPRFGARMKGEGVFADLIAKRFARACDRLGFNERRFKLDVTQFRAPVTARARSQKAAETPQLSLF